MPFVDHAAWFLEQGRETTDREDWEAGVKAQIEA